MAIIQLNNLEFFAFHGCFKEERIIGNRFLVNVSLETDTSEAEETDDLTKTINYQEVYKLVKTEMEIASKLLENVARRIITSLSIKYPKLSNIEITVSKINPALGGKVESVSVKLNHHNRTSV
jgi:7,8-dihydroneopterin aldolase/epimerase/oxygenase